MQSNWERVQEIFLAALEQDPAARTDFVRTRCNGDSVAYDEVMSLLRSHDEASDFIEEPLLPVSAASFDPAPPELAPGDVIGAYTIVALIGSAGMGEVYLARDNEFHRQVAIKLIKRGLLSAETIHQFAREERILASLNHPNIARFYEGAIRPGAGPYFVMEYVAGTRIDRYCSEHRLPIRERLELFRKVCASVHFAHQHLIVHRDLKPSNILVTKQGEPKLLDFGVGKLLKPKEASLEATMTVATVMTPEYASPEHILAQEVTTSSDIYSLGVLLYELLSGQRPYKLETRRPDEIAKVICEKEPLRPSAAILKDDSDSKIEIRNPKSLRGDLDNIVLMAMRKEPARRYTSAAELSEDISRYLNGRPVIARSDTLVYRVHKFVSRNKIAVTATVLIVAALLTGLITALWQKRIAREERDTAQRITSFLQDMLGAAAPEARGKDVKVAEVLSEASKRARIDLQSQPKTMAEVLLTLGRTYLSLDQVSAAEPELRAALVTSLKVNGERNETTTTSMAWLGIALAYLNQAKEGEAISSRAAALERELHPKGSETLAIALFSKGLNSLLLGRGKKAVPVLQKACVMVKAHLGQSHGYYVAGLDALGQAYAQVGDLNQAEATLRTAAEAGSTLEPRYQNFHAQAEAYLGELLIRKGKFTEAEGFLRRGEDDYRRHMGDNTLSSGELEQDLGEVDLQRNEYARAEKELRNSLEILRKNLPPVHPSLLRSEVLLGLDLTRAHRLVEGERYLRKDLELERKRSPSDSVDVAFTEGALGECLLDEKRYAEAAPLLRASYAMLRAQRGEHDPLTIEAEERLKSLPPTP